MTNGGINLIALAKSPECLIDQMFPKGLNRHFYHSVEQCRDIIVDLQLPKNLEKDAQGIPIVNASIPLKVVVSNKDALMMEAERSEVVYFLDNQLLYENETSYYPYTWHWDSSGMPAGVYVVTGFIVGFKEHFGIASAKVRVGRQSLAVRTGSTEQMIDKEVFDEVQSRKSKAK